MSQTYNVYCDESCYLENDNYQVMVLGAVWCPIERTSEISRKIRAIKTEHKLDNNFEIKWTKVSPAKEAFYLDIIEYFFDEKDLHFRALIVPDKSKLNHLRHSQTHDEWYYKMYFDMLKIILSPQDCYRIYLDIKDTHGGRKTKKLHDVLCNSMYDFSQEIIERIQQVRSHEVEILQITDLLIGAIAYANRGLSTNTGKVELINLIKKLSHYSLTKTTLFKENKLNLFRWKESEI